MSTSPFSTVLDDVEVTADSEDMKRRARVVLMAMRLTGQIDDEGMSEIGQALGLFADTPKPRDRHGMRAVPNDNKRRGAVGIS